MAKTVEVVNKQRETFINQLASSNLQNNERLIAYQENINRLELNERQSHAQIEKDAKAEAEKYNSSNAIIQFEDTKHIDTIANVEKQRKELKAEIERLRGYVALEKDEYKILRKEWSEMKGTLTNSTLTNSFKFIQGTQGAQFDASQSRLALPPSNQNPTSPLESSHLSSILSTDSSETLMGNLQKLISAFNDTSRTNVETRFGGLDSQSQEQCLKCIHGIVKEKGILKKGGWEPDCYTQCAVVALFNDGHTCEHGCEIIFDNGVNAKGQPSMVVSHPGECKCED